MTDISFQTSQRMESVGANFNSIKYLKRGTNFREHRNITSYEIPTGREGVFRQPKDC